MIERLATFLGVSSGICDLDSALSTAEAMIEGYCGAALVDVPTEVLDRATVELAAVIYRRKLAGGAGGAQFASPDSGPVMYARDPMVTIYPVLNRWLGGGFA